MILSDQSIRTRCRPRYLTHVPLIEPFDERTVCEGMSYGLSSCGYDVRARVVGENHLLNPGDFVLISTIEKINMDDDIAGMVMDKSTWARQGIALQNTILEPGWSGHITLEVSNHGNKSVWLITGAPICQIVFHKLDRPTTQPYEGKYQDQIDEPVEAIYE